MYIIVIVFNCIVYVHKLYTSSNNKSIFLKQKLGTIS